MKCHFEGSLFFLIGKGHHDHSLEKETTPAEDKDLLDFSNLLKKILELFLVDPVKA